MWILPSLSDIFHPCLSYCSFSCKASSSLCPLLAVPSRCSSLPYLKASFPPLFCFYFLCILRRLLFDVASAFCGTLSLRLFFGPFSLLQRSMLPVLFFLSFFLLLMSSSFVRRVSPSPSFNKLFLPSFLSFYCVSAFIFFHGFSFLVYSYLFLHSSNQSFLLSIPSGRIFNSGVYIIALILTEENVCYILFFPFFFIAA